MLMKINDHGAILTCDQRLILIERQIITVYNNTI